MNKVLLAAGVGAVLSVALGGCSSGGDGAAANAAASVDTSEIATSIRMLENAQLRAYEAKDTKKAMAFYSDNATAMFPGEAVIHGKADIAKAIDGFAKDPGFHMQMEDQKVDVAASGDMAYSRGTYALTYTNPQKKLVTQKGNYVTVFRKEGDDWKAVEDIASASSDS